MFYGSSKNDAPRGTNRRCRMRAAGASLINPARESSNQTRIRSDPDHGGGRDPVWIAPLTPDPRAGRQHPGGKYCSSVRQAGFAEGVERDDTVCHARKALIPGSTTVHGESPTLRPCAELHTHSSKSSHPVGRPGGWRGVYILYARTDGQKERAVEHEPVLGTWNSGPWPRCGTRGRLP